LLFYVMVSDAKEELRQRITCAYMHTYIGLIICVICEIYVVFEAVNFFRSIRLLSNVCIGPLDRSVIVSVPTF
jgi:hypothetical protein